MVRAEKQFYTAGRIAPRQSEAGFSLLEVSVAVAVGVLCVLTLGQALSGAAGSSESIVRQADLNAQVHRSFGALRRELRSSNPDLAEISTHADGNDILVLKTCGPYSEVFRWGACDNSGEWRAGWSARFRVVEGQLVREALDLSGAVRGEPRPLARGVPLRELDEKGFSVEKDGSLFTISISMRRTFRDGSELRRVFSTAVKTLPGLLGS
ncbi:MAG: hypothetical protein MK554_11235 [Planctomycetes bacterium]|nr:hypothetical protein [Planctomycetota bacterium]